MATNEIQTKNNYYSSLITTNPDVVDQLKKHEEKIAEIRERSSLEIGKEVFEAKQLLTDQKLESSFKEWVELMGLSTSTAYNLANYYEATLSLSDAEIEMFNKLPKRLSYAMSASLKIPKEERGQIANHAIESVFSGDITTLPEFQEAISVKDQKIADLEKQLQDKDFELINMGDDYDELKEALAQARQQPTQQKIVEKVPDDYAELQEEHKRTIAQLKEVQNSLQQRDSKLRQLVEEKKDLETRFEHTHEDDENYAIMAKELEEKKDLVDKQAQQIEELQNAAEYITTANETLEKSLVPMLGYLNSASESTRNDMKPALSNFKSRLEQMLVAVDTQLQAQ